MDEPREASRHLQARWPIAICGVLCFIGLGTSVAADAAMAVNFPADPDERLVAVKALVTVPILLSPLYLPTGLAVLLSLRGHWWYAGAATLTLPTFLAGFTMFALISAVVSPFVDTGGAAWGWVLAAMIVGSPIPPTLWAAYRLLQLGEAQRRAAGRSRSGRRRLLDEVIEKFLNDPFAMFGD